MGGRGIVGTIALISACSSEPARPPAPPVIDAAAVATNPNNVLSGVVAMDVHFADSVIVRFGLEGNPLDSTTAAVIPLDDAAVVPVLGLLPDTHYTLQVVAYGGGQGVAGDALTFVTGTLPVDLPHYVASGSSPSPGYVAFAAAMYGLVIDNTGRVVWYHHFPNSPGLNFQALSTGRFAARPPGPPGLWVELDPLGDVTRTFGCVGGLVPRFHDLIAERDGAYWIMCDDTRTMDLSAQGGVANAQVTGTVVQHVSGDGALLFQWNPFEHFSITDLPLADRTGATVNWTHGNALDLDADGNLVVSFRSLNEITKIDTGTGAVVWRMGGLQNEFAFPDSPMPAFARQHGLRLTGPESFVVLDNMGDPTASRAERYAFDPDARSARLVAFYGSLPAVTATLGGTTQDLPGGRTLVAFGNGGRVEEYDASGGVVWRIDGNPGYVFRAQRIRSLYRPGVDSPR